VDHLLQALDQDLLDVLLDEVEESSPVRVAARMRTGCSPA